TQLADVANLVEHRLAEMESSLQSCCFSSNVDGVANQLVTLPAASEQPTLQQNMPNPFHAQSAIRYYLPASTNDAVLQITDVQGQVLQSVVIAEKGAGQITLSAGQLGAGSYFYTLIVDGQPIATKKMILTK
ncbi:MAG: T9SS type A sorting domain-containing protein, partial [Saprospiraceae bacterium]